MRITRLEIDNFKRLSAVSIAPDGSAVVIGGNNGQGKSSCLDAIEAALGGARHAPGEPVKRGAKSARVVVETDEFVVTRKWTAKGSQLEVKAKDGSIYPSPQALLDGLVGSLSFDPFAFTRLKPKEQAETLRKLVGLEFVKENAKREEAFAKRTEVGRELRRLQGALEKLPEPPKDTPAAEVSVAELAEELERRQKVNADNDEKRRELGQKRELAMSIKAEIDELEAKLVAARERFDAINAEGKALADKVKALVDEDVDAVKQRIANAEATNRNVRLKAERAQLEAELDAAVAESERLTQYIRQIDEVKADAAAKAEYPIEGLAVTDDGITLDGVPFEQASQAERLRASVAIGLALNPKLKVLLVRDGALLDERSLAMVADMAAKHDAQVWIEVVGQRDGVTVVIEDGEVAGSAAEASASASASA